MINEIEGQMSIFDFLDQDSWCGKTCQEHSAPTREKISDASSKKQRKSSVKMPLYLNLRKENGLRVDASWETGGALLGEYMMHSFGESPKEENVSRLSQILEGGAAPEILFERESVSGDFETSLKQGQGTSTDTKSGVDKTESYGFFPQMKAEGIAFKKEKSGALVIGTNLGYQNAVLTNECFSMQRSDQYKENEVSSTQSARQYKDNTDLIVTYGLDRASFNQGENALYDFSVIEEQSQTLVARGPGGVLAKRSEHCAPETTKE